MFAFFAPDYGSKNLHPGSFGLGGQLVDNLVNGLLLDFLAALGAVRRADAGPKQAQIVVNFRHCAHGGSGVFGGGLLVDGNGGRQALDIIHVRFFHLPQKHPSIGGKRLHVTALALGINGVKGQRAFARAGDAGDHRQRVPGDDDVYILQIMHSGPFYYDFIQHGFVTVPLKPKLGGSPFYEK